MENFTNVIGSKESARILIIGKDTVYVHKNIVLISEEENLYQYDEVQYTKDEYIQLLSEKKDCLLKKTFEMQDTLDFLLFEE